MIPDKYKKCDQREDCSNPFDEQELIAQHIAKTKLAIDDALLAMEKNMPKHRIKRFIKKMLYKFNDTSKFNGMNGIREDE